MHPFHIYKVQAGCSPHREATSGPGWGWHFHVNGKFYINVRLAARLFKHWKLLTSWQDRILIKKVTFLRHSHLWDFDVLAELSPNGKGYRQSCGYFTNNKKVTLFLVPLLENYSVAQLLITIMVFKDLANKSQNHGDNVSHAIKGWQCIVHWKTSKYTKKFSEANSDPSFHGNYLHSRKGDPRCCTAF